MTLRALTKLKRSQDVEKVNIATAKIREAGHTILENGTENIAILYCDILYCYNGILQYIVLLQWNIAIYCIVTMEYCNILYCYNGVLQYIVLL